MIAISLLEDLTVFEKKYLLREREKAQLRSLKIKKKNSFCREDLVGICLRQLAESPILLEDLCGRFKNPLFRAKRHDLIRHLAERGAGPTLIAKVFSINRQTVIKTLRKYQQKKPKELHER